MTRIVVAAVFVLAAVAIADALRSGPEPTAVSGSEAAARTSPPTAFAPGFTLEGRFYQQRVLLDGREYLSAEAVAGAFPSDKRGFVDVVALATGRERTLVLGVVNVPPRSRAGTTAGLEFWRGQELVRTVEVPPQEIAGGLRFNAIGSLVTTFDAHGRQTGIYSRDGVPGSARSG